MQYVISNEMQYFVFYFLKFICRYYVITEQVINHNKYHHNNHLNFKFQFLILSIIIIRVIILDIFVIVCKHISTLGIYNKIKTTKTIIQNNVSLPYLSI